MSNIDDWMNDWNVPHNLPAWTRLSWWMKSQEERKNELYPPCHRLYWIASREDGENGYTWKKEYGLSPHKEPIHWGPNNCELTRVGKGIVERGIAVDLEEDWRWELEEVKRQRLSINYQTKEKEKKKKSRITNRERCTMLWKYILIKTILASSTKCIPLIPYLPSFEMQ